MPTSNVDPCQFLQWDSDFFGFGVARVRGDVLTEDLCRQINQWCAERSVSCLYFAARPDDLRTMRLAETGGFRLVDVRMTFERKVDPGERFEDASVRPARLEDVPILQDIARQSHRDTRFHYDEHFGPERSDALYAHWIKVSCEGYADAVLVWEDDDKVSGYVSCHLAAGKQAGKIGLVGVAEKARGKGVGPALVRCALKWFTERSARQISVVTQARNTAAQRLYQRCGFLTQSVSLYYHKWYGR